MSVGDTSLIYTALSSDGSSIKPVSEYIPISFIETLFEGAFAVLVNHISKVSTDA